MKGNRENVKACAVKKQLFVQVCLSKYIFLIFSKNNNRKRFQKVMCSNCDHGCANLHTMFILSIETPYLLTILVLKFETVHSTTR